MIPSKAVEEEFCDDCWAGMESVEHHEKCIRPKEIAMIPREAVEAAHVYMCPCEKHVKERRELWRIRFADRKVAAERKARK